MGYWKDVREVILKGFDIAIDGIKEGATKAVEMGKDGVAYTQLKTNLFFEHRKLQIALADLGDHTRDLFTEKKDIYADKGITEIMSNIGTIEDECKRMQSKIQSLGYELNKV
jgi:flagellar capping protein FliD